MVRAAFYAGAAEAARTGIATLDQTDPLAATPLVRQLAATMINEAERMRDLLRHGVLPVLALMLI